MRIIREVLDGPDDLDGSDGVIYCAGCDIMIAYKNELRLRVQAKKGTIQPPDLKSDPDYESPLDKEIIACAGKYVSSSQLSAFFWAYHCLNTWEDIQMHFKTYLNKELQVDTVQRYARDAANRIVDRITQS